MSVEKPEDLSIESAKVLKKNISVSNSRKYKKKNLSLQSMEFNYDSAEKNDLKEFCRRKISINYLISSFLLRQMRAGICEGFHSHVMIEYQLPADEGAAEHETEGKRGNISRLPESINF